MAQPGIDINFPDPMSLRLASLFVDISEQRLRTLIREGKIKATQDADGKYSVTKAALTDYQAEKSHGGATNGGAGSGKSYVIKVPAKDHDKVEIGRAHV
jgi:hypothetical protein